MNPHGRPNPLGADAPSIRPRTAHRAQLREQIRGELADAFPAGVESSGPAPWTLTQYARLALPLLVLLALSIGWAGGGGQLRGRTLAAGCTRADWRAAGLGDLMDGEDAGRPAAGFIAIPVDSVLTPAPAPAASIETQLRDRQAWAE